MIGSESFRFGRLSIGPVCTENSGLGFTMATVAFKNQRVRAGVTIRFLCNFA